jgi:hypothetical protein
VTLGRLHGCALDRRLQQNLGRLLVDLSVRALVNCFSVGFELLIGLDCVEVVISPF